MRKTLSSALLGLLVFVPFGAPQATAAGCKAMRPGVSASQTGQHGEAAEAPVQLVTDKATEKNPLVIEYKHGPGLDPGYSYDVIVADGSFFNFQIRTRKQPRTINFRAEWPAPSPQDVELILYDANGNEVANSASFNPVPEVSNEDDGNGWEQILGIGGLNCEGFTLESQGGITVDTPMTLKVWLD